MKVYVDELPKNCVNCDFGYANNFCELDYKLDLRKFDKNQKHPRCPLQSLTDYTKQVRKEVVQEIKQEVEKEKEENDLAWLGFKKLNRILNKMQELEKEIK